MSFLHNCDLEFLLLMHCFPNFAYASSTFNRFLMFFSSNNSVEMEIITSVWSISCFFVLGLLCPTKCGSGTDLGFLQSNEAVSGT